MNPEDKAAAIKRRKAPLNAPTDLGVVAARDITGALNALLADVFATYFKTKNSHWHMSGPHFLAWHELLEEHAAEILAMTDEMAERVRKIGGTTVRSIGHVTRLQHIEDNDEDFVTPEGMLAEIRQDNVQLIVEMRATHELCSETHDSSTSSLLENWIDQAERRAWFLFEILRT